MQETDSLKILFVNYEFPPIGGGGGDALFELLNLVSRHHQVDVLTSSASGRFQTESCFEGRVRVYRVPITRRPTRASASIVSLLAFVFTGLIYGVRLVRQNRYDLVNSWFAIPSGLVGLPLAWLSGAPHLVSLLGMDVYDPTRWYGPDRNWLLNTIVHQVMKHSQGATSPSVDLARRARTQFPKSPPIKILPHGISPRQASSQTRAQLGLDQDKTYVVCLARLVPRKNHQLLLKAMAQQDSSVELLLIGDGPEQTRLVELSHTLGIASRVHFRHYVSQAEKDALLANSDIFCMVSLHEAMGLAYLEAMRYSLPVVAGDVGGQLDFIEHEVTGLLVPFDDEPALAETLRSLADDAKLRKRLGANGRAHSESYLIQNTAPPFQQYLESFCSSTND